jgi:hypothetical protein
MSEWKKFLQSIADEHHLPPLPRILFLFQFDRERRNWSVKKIEEEFLKINQGTSNNFDDYRKRMYGALAFWCPELASDPRNKADIVWQSLEEKYPTWIRKNIPPNLDEIWQRLWADGEDGSDMFGPITQASLKTLGGIGDEIERTNSSSEFFRFLKRGAAIKIKVNPVVSGEIIILERNQQGHIFCLCPSYIQKEYFLTDRPLLIPAGEEFVSMEEPDVLQLCMVTASQLPRFDWLPLTNKQSLQIKSNELKDVLEQSISISSAKIWINSYIVRD